MRVLSLGWGIQSFTLAAMSALDDIERVDYAIHVDTTHEFGGTYAFARRWTPWLEEHGIRVITVQPHIKADPVRCYGRVAIPAYYPASNNKPEGMLNRECTNNWKRRNLRKWLRANHQGKLVEQWLGISLDEFQRMRGSDVKYIINRWPLVERKMTRFSCKKWLFDHALEIPPKSSCNFCPFHNNFEWRYIKASQMDWKEAVGVDNEIRNARPPYKLFIHSSRKPLELVDLRTQEEKGQMRLWDEECSGYCGV